MVVCKVLFSFSFVCRCSLEVYVVFCYRYSIIIIIQRCSYFAMQELLGPGVHSLLIHT